MGLFIYLFRKNGCEKMGNKISDKTLHYFQKLLCKTYFCQKTLTERKKYFLCSSGILPFSGQQ